MKLEHINGHYSVLRYPPDTDIPEWVLKTSVFFIGRTHEELSIVCRTDAIENPPQNVEHNWQCLRVQGTLDFSLTGVLASITMPLAEARISIFAVSTFDTDYVLIRDDKIQEAKSVLLETGFELV